MSLFNWTVDLPTESMHMLNDLVRMGVIQLVVQFLFFAANPTENPFFSTMFLQTIGFVLVGVLVYWLLVRNLFSFQSAHAVQVHPSALPAHAHTHAHADATTTDTASSSSDSPTDPHADKDPAANTTVAASGAENDQ